MNINPYGKGGKYTLDRMTDRRRSDIEHTRKQNEEALLEEDKLVKVLRKRKENEAYLKKHPNTSEYRRESIGQLQDENQRFISGYVANIRTGMEDNLMDSVGLGEHKESLRLLTRKGPGGFKGNLKVLGLRAGTRLLTNLPGLIIGAAKSQIDGAGQRQKIGAALGASDNEMQALNFASDRFGADADTLYSAVNNLGYGRDAAISGDTQAQKAFSALGVSEADLFTKSNVDLLAQLTSQFESGKVSAEQFRAGIALLGEEFQKLQPAMEKGLGKSIVEFQGSALAMDPNTSRTLAELAEGSSMIADLSGKATSAVGGGIRTITSTAGAGLTKVMGGLLNGATFLGKFGMAVGANLLSPVSDTAAEFRNHLLDSLQEQEGDEQTVELGKTLDRKKAARAAAEAERSRLAAEEQEQQQQKLAQAKELEAENLERLRARKEAEKPTGKKLAELVSFRKGLKNMILAEQDPLRQQQLIRGDIAAEDDELVLRQMLVGERKPNQFSYKPPGLDKLARSGIYTGTATAHHAQQRPDIQRAMLLELRDLSRAVERNTQVIDQVLGGP